MAIMAMVMAQIKKGLVPLLLIITLPVQSGEWTFDPNIALEETFTDNVELTITDPTASFVSQFIAGLDSTYNSRLAEINFSATTSYALFSHDRELNDSFNTLAADGLFSLWTSGPALVGSASLTNINRSNASNSLADLVNGDTIEARSLTFGLQYNTGNTNYNVESSVIYRITDNEDGIGNSDGFTALFNTSNGNATRNMFWLLQSSYTERNQNSTVNSENTLYGQNSLFDLMLGLTTSFTVNPFIRVYDEQVKGNAQNNLSTTPSWGPGLRWKVSSHLLVDISYNYVVDEEVSDDYIAGNVSWEPSARTTLKAGFSQRFFGKSYDFEFNHKLKRLSNFISYHENLEVFDRNNYQNTTLGTFWCPVDNFSGEMAQCYAQEGQGNNFEDYTLATFSGLELLESNEFSLNKRLSWVTELALSRTTFTFKASGQNREGLQSKIIDENFDVGITALRKTSARSDLSFSLNFRYSIFDKNNPNGSRQEDYYRTASTTYTQKLASSLSANVSLQYLDRASNFDRYSYEEVRAIFNIKKDF